MTTGRHRPRRLAILALSFMGGLLALEMAFRVTHYARYRRAFPAADVRARLSAGALPAPADGIQTVVPGAVGTRRLHPYLGYVLDPDASPGVVNRYGFYGPEPLTRPRGDKEVVIAVLGGEAAVSFGRTGAPHLGSLLAAAPGFRDREIRFVLLALEGYKQPQQLQALAYFQTLGASYDLVVNLDGFNEIVLPISENVPAAVAPTFPSRWHLLAQRSIDLTTIRLFSANRDAGARRAAWRRPARHPVLGHSAALLALLDAGDRRLGRALADSEERLRARIADADGRPSIRGPVAPIDSPARLFADMAQVWKRSSMEMESLSEAANGDYFHFLQPTRYLRDSPPQAASQPVGFAADAATRTAVEQGYPLLRAAGRELVERGVRFTDLTGVFAREGRPVYVDGGSRLSPLGARLMAERIAEVLLEAAAGAG